MKLLPQFLGCLFICFFIWLLWAALSEGGLHQLKQINPDYPQLDRSLAYLISQLHKGERDGWSAKHVEYCAIYMPNWEKAEKCVETRKSCEYTSPYLKNDYFKRKDIFSDQFKECVERNRPAYGISEWSHAYRILFRIIITTIVFKLTRGDKHGQQAVEWDENNKWWAQPLFDWMERGE